MSDLVFCKLGGSVITDKGQAKRARHDVIARLAGEVARSLAACPDLRLVLGHGSGSYGHMEAKRYNTRHGAHTTADWRGFCQVAAAAAQLDRIVADAFLEAGVPVWALPPSASARCRAGELVSLSVEPVQEGLRHGIVPLVYGDVAWDEALGATIVSTEQVLAHLARQLRPARLVLVSAVDGVYTADPVRDPSAQRIPRISPENWAAVRAALGGSHAPDVTGGMLSKVEAMIALAREVPGLTAHIVSGERAGALEDLLCAPGAAVGGTTVRWATT